MRPDVRNAAFLRDISAEALRGYGAIYLFDVDRLDDRAVANLESYVRGGGGLAFFVGPQVQLRFYNESLYRAGEGLFPLSLDRDDFLDFDDLGGAPDVEIELPDHPLLNELALGQNPIARMIRVERFLRPELGWFPTAESGVRVLARLRNHSPLIVEKSWGRGRVIAVLTTYAPLGTIWSSAPAADRPAATVVSGLLAADHPGASGRRADRRATRCRTVPAGRAAVPAR